MTSLVTRDPPEKRETALERGGNGVPSLLRAARACASRRGRRTHLGAGLSGKSAGKAVRAADAWLRPRRPTALLGVVVAALALSACGSRLSDEAIANAAHRPIVHGEAQSTAGATTGGSATAAPGGAASSAAAMTGAAGGTSSPGLERRHRRRNGSGRLPVAAAPAATAPAVAAASKGSTINLGNVGTYSGVIGAVFSGAEQTIGVWQAYVNAHGVSTDIPCTSTSRTTGATPPPASPTSNRK